MLIGGLFRFLKSQDVCIILSFQELNHLSWIDFSEKKETIVHYLRSHGDLKKSNMFKIKEKIYIDYEEVEILS